MFIMKYTLVDGFQDGWMDECMDELKNGFMDG